MITTKALILGFECIKRAQKKDIRVNFGGLKCQNKCLCFYRRILSTFFIPFSSEARKCECFVRHSAHDACDPFVIITPRFHNIIASDVVMMRHMHISRTLLHVTRSGFQNLRLGGMVKLGRQCRDTYSRLSLNGIFKQRHAGIRIAIGRRYDIRNQCHVE